MTPVAALDFLTLPIEGGGVILEGSTFDVLGPWGFAEFGERKFKGGWWVFELDFDGDAFGCEVRLSSAEHPLIVAAGDLAGTFRLHVEEGAVFDVRLLVSPWPGKVGARRMRLRRLSAVEEIGMYAAAGKRLLGTDKPLTRIAGAAKRVLSGRTVGVQVADAAEAQAARRADLVEPGRERIERHGDVVVAMREGDRLHPRALELVRAEFVRPEAQAVYGDVIEGGHITPKGGWDPLLAQGCDLAGSPVFFRGEGEGGARERLEAIVAQHGAGAVKRVALPLAERTAMVRQAISVPPEPVLARTPRVSAIIPTKFRVDLLEACLEGLAASGYPDVEAVIVDNGCEDKRLGDVLEAAGKKLRLSKVEDFGAFNFPRLIASGVAQASGEVVLVLNDDIEAKAPGWLARIVESAMDRDVGAVGARLLYPDGSIQHAGVMMGLGGVCGHLWKGTSPEDATRNPAIVLPGQRMAVTGACLAVRRTVWDEVGGMDAEAFPVAFNDIDLCLRLRAAGYRIVYRGDAVLTHHESQSRGADDMDEARRKRLAAETERFQARWQHLLADDPFGSPAFDMTRESGVVHRSLRPR